MHALQKKMARWSSSAISLAFGAIIALCLGLLGWNIALQVQVSTKTGGSPFDIVATRSSLSQITTTNDQTIKYVATSVGVDTGAGFSTIMSITIQTQRNGRELMQMFIFFTFPFNGVATGTDPIWVDYDIPASFLGNVFLNASTPITSGATGTTDPTFVVARAYSPNAFGNVTYPLNWIRLECIPLASAAHQTYQSMTMVVAAQSS
jgi:hypothetical protein